MSSLLQPEGPLAFVLVGRGYHLYFHQIGPDHDGFFQFWSDTLQSALADKFDIEDE